MAKPEILILDEPSSGLDPLMQQKLISLILKHQALGATIFYLLTSLKRLKKFVIG